MKILSIVVASSALFLASCGSGPGTEEELVGALELSEQIDRPTAECVAEAVFDEYGNNDDALNRITGADNLEDLTPAEFNPEAEDTTAADDGTSVEGFDVFYEATLQSCIN